MDVTEIISPEKKRNLKNQNYVILTSQHVTLTTHYFYRNYYYRNNTRIKRYHYQYFKILFEKNYRNNIVPKSISRNWFLSLTSGLQAPVISVLLRWPKVAWDGGLSGNDDDASNWYFNISPWELVAETTPGVKNMMRENCMRLKNNASSLKNNALSLKWVIILIKHFLTT